MTGRLHEKTISVSYTHLDVYKRQDDGRRIQWGPDGAVLEELRDYGRTLAEKFR